MYMVEVEKVVVRIAQEIVAWQSQNSGLFRLGVCGGRFANELYRALAVRTDVDWGRVLLILTDERFVESASSDSNLGALAENLIFPAGISLDNVVFFDTEEGADYLESAEMMDRQLAELLAERAPLFDLLILSAGPDFHIASLFPESLTVDRDCLLLAQTATTEKFAVPRRLSLSYKALRQFGQLCLLVVGEDKANVRKQIAETGLVDAKLAEELPLYQLFADAGAAAKLVDDSRAWLVGG
jgi:6-phosphogluconolactonase